jgi:hypothetical protein
VNKWNNVGIIVYGLGVLGVGFYILSLQHFEEVELGQYLGLVLIWAHGIGQLLYLSIATKLLSYPLYKQLDALDDFFANLDEGDVTVVGVPIWAKIVCVYNFIGQIVLLLAAIFFFNGLIRTLGRGSGGIIEILLLLGTILMCGLAVLCLVYGIRTIGTKRIRVGSVNEKSHDLPDF